LLAGTPTTAGIEIRQTGSHKIFVHKDYDFSLPVPYHGTKEVATGLAEKILKQAGLKNKG